MTTNPYFNHTGQTSEQELFEDMVIEMIQLKGVDIQYIPRNILVMDPVLREPKSEVFKGAYTIEAYLPDTGNYGGEQNLMSKFGFRINQVTEILISKRRWAEIGLGPEFVRPRAGDLIYIGNVRTPYGTYTNSLFEINHVWYQEPDWQFGRHFTFKLDCETFTYSHESMETGIETVDKLSHDSVQREIDEAINDKLQPDKEALMKFDTNNPFGSF